MTQPKPPGTMPGMPPPPAVAPVRTGSLELACGPDGRDVFDAAVAGLPTTRVTIVIDGTDLSEDELRTTLALAGRIRPAVLAVAGAHGDTVFASLVATATTGVRVLCHTRDLTFDTAAAALAASVPDFWADLAGPHLIRVLETPA